MVFFFSSLITQFSPLISYHSFFITHYLKYPNFPNPTCLDIVFSSHHSKFSTFCGPHTCNLVQFLLFFSPLQPSIPKLTKPSEKKKRKKKKKIKKTRPDLAWKEEEEEEEEDHLVWKEKEKKEEEELKLHEPSVKKKKKNSSNLVNEEEKKNLMKKTRLDQT